MRVPVEVEFWWYFIVAAVKHGAAGLAKRLWRLAFDYRQLGWESASSAEAWITWGPRLGFSFDVNLSFMPGHKGDPDDEFDDDYGPELHVGFGLGWIDGGLDIPNGNHAENHILMPKHYCSCGEETQSRIAHYCTGCDEVDCTCELTEPGRPLFM